MLASINEGGRVMNKRYDYKDQEFNLKMRIKFLEKKLREPDHDVEKYQEWESNLEMVREELTNLQLKKFKFFLSKWIHNFKTGSQTVNVIDCMFVSMEEDEQKEMAVKWYHRVVKEKDIKHYQLFAQYTREENQMLKKRLKDFQKSKKKEVKQLTNARLLEFRKKESEFKTKKDQAIKQSKEAMSRNYDTLIRSNNKRINQLQDISERQKETIKTLNERIDELEDQKYQLHKKLKKIDAMQEEIDKRAEVYKEGLIKSGLKNILQKEDL